MYDAMTGTTLTFDWFSAITSSKQVANNKKSLTSNVKPPQCEKSNAERQCQSDHRGGPTILGEERYSYIAEEECCGLPSSHSCALAWTKK